MLLVMGCALTGIDVESNGFVFADMAADRKSARAARLGRGGCWLAVLHFGTDWYTLQNPGLLVLIVMICGWKSSPFRHASCAFMRMNV